MLKNNHLPHISTITLLNFATFMFMTEVGLCSFAALQLTEVGLSTFAAWGAMKFHQTFNNLVSKRNTEEEICELLSIY